MAEKEKSIRPFADASKQNSLHRKEAQNLRNEYCRHMNRQIHRYIDNI